MFSRESIPDTDKIESKITSMLPSAFVLFKELYFKDIVFP